MINGTILFQIFHFFVAYLLFKSILLKPVLLVIEKEEYEGAQLNREIVSLRNQVVAQGEFRERVWTECVQKIGVMRPSVFTCPESAMSDTVEVVSEPLAQEEKDKVTEALTTTLVDRLSGV